MNEITEIVAHVRGAKGAVERVASGLRELRAKRETMSAKDIDAELSALRFGLDCAAFGLEQAERHAESIDQQMLIETVFRVLPCQPDQETGRSPLADVEGEDFYSLDELKSECAFALRRAAGRKYEVVSSQLEHNIKDCVEQFAEGRDYERRYVLRLRKSFRGTIGESLWS